MPHWVTLAFDEYAKRMPAHMPLSLIEIKPENRNSGKSIPQMLSLEKERILTNLPSRCKMIALDEKGENLDTLQFVSRLKIWIEDDVTFIIGGADGLDPELKKKSNLQLRLSSLTLPHAIARVVLAEQLYRAVSILQNHPYHRS